jgi:rhomboid protease GluP
MTETGKSRTATWLIGLAIVAGFGLELLNGAWNDGDKLAEMGAIRYWDVMVEGEYWRLVAAMFLHAGWLHLAVNLLSLGQLGRLYELMFGTRRFVLIYFASGLAASVTTLLRSGGPSVGASGAIFGILGAFIFSIRRSPRWRNERFAKAILPQLIFWMIANLVIGMSVPRIDNAAHVGGLVAGLLLGALLPPHRTPPPPPAQVVIDVTPYDEGSFGDPAVRRDDR